MKADQEVLAKIEPEMKEEMKTNQERVEAKDRGQ
jgi:hypothetical protein